MYSKKILLKNRKQLTLELNEEWDCIKFYDNGLKLEGEFEFKDESLDNVMEDFLLKRMYCPIQYINQGLGTEVLKFFREKSCCKSLYARPNDGIDRNDGSKLTDKAIIFVDKMLKKNLIDYQK